MRRTTYWIPFRPILDLLVLFLFAFATIGRAQAPPAPQEEPVELGRTLLDDPGVLAEDLPPEEPATLGQPDEVIPHDPSQAQDEASFLAHPVPEDLRFDPDAASALCPVSGTPPPLPASRVCRETARTAFRPIGYWSANPRYFFWQGKPRIFFGVSADNGCHLKLDPSVCNRDNFREVICDGFRRDLDKIRLWVETASDAEPSNHPFAFDGTRYILDVRNDSYFDRLRQVVELAKRLNLLVEITFLAPWGKDSLFAAGPWAPGKARLANGSLLPGYPDRRNFAMPDNPMLPYQKNVIAWTIRELWCYDNVTWEIANEPELQGLDPAYVDRWQDQLIAHVRTLEENTYRSLGLAAPHLIAVQPFTAEGVQHYKLDSRVAILGGHYSQALTAAAPAFPSNLPKALDRGAIDLVRKDGTVPKIFEFNEGKITGVTNPAPKDRQFFTRGYVSDSAGSYGGADAARAEAWELYLGRGASFDHFGYVYSSDEGKAIRNQVAKIKALVGRTTAPNTQPDIFFLLPSATSGPAWIRNPAPYPGPQSGLDPGLNSQRYWAAMESPGFTSTPTGRKFLLYVHRSAPRCKPSANADPSYTATGLCASYLTFQGYDARRSANRYRENLTLNLGTRSGTFDIEWIDPATGAPARDLFGSAATTTLVFDAATSTCAQARCIVTSPYYDFDILLRVTQR